MLGCKEAGTEDNLNRNKLQFVEQIITAADLIVSGCAVFRRKGTSPVCLGLTSSPKGRAVGIDFAVRWVYNTDKQIYRGGKRMNVTLRKWGIQDRDVLMHLCNRVNREYLSDRLPYPYTEKDAMWYLNMVSEHDGVDAVFRAVLVDDEIVGTISVEQKSDVYRKDGEIGYFLATENWSKGIMTNAVKQMCQIAFDKLDIIRITGLVYEKNIPSQKVLEKNGFQKEGLMSNAVIKNGQIHNLCIYGKLK